MSRQKIRLLRSSWNKKSRSKSSRSGRRKSRQRLIEQLERRELLAAAIWHNPLHPVDVSGDQPAVVSALDVLLVVNRLNDQSQDNFLPSQVVAPTDGPYYDVNCDGIVSPIDALTVINYLNNFGSSVLGGYQTDGGVFVGAACSPKLIEGSRFVNELERILIVPPSRQALKVSFQAPEFDESAVQQIRDAFEIHIVQADGNLVTNRLSASRPAAFNWTEGFEPTVARGAWMEIAGPGEDSSVTFDLSEFASGQQVHLRMRLINNDSDNSTQVTIRGYEFVELPSERPSGVAEALSIARSPSTRLLYIEEFSDVSGLFEIDYGRTSLSTDQVQLVSQATLTNVSSSAVVSPIVAVIEGFSDPNIFAMRPDGVLPDGRVFFNLTSNTDHSVISPGQVISGPEFQFLNEARQRFDYRLSIHGRINTGPSHFTTQPVTSIEASKRYSYVARAQSTIDPKLVYSMRSGPEGMAIDANTGALQWLTTDSDVGAYPITVRATDSFGLYVEQNFELEVHESLANRPPVFVSEPDTEAVAAGAFEVITLPTVSLPSGLAVGNFGVLNNGAGDSSTSINQLSLVAINQGSQTISLIPGLGRDCAGREIYGPTRSLSVGEPPRGDELFRGVLDIDVGLPPLGNTIYDSNRIMGLAHGDFNGDGILDVATSIVYQYRPFTGPDAYERRMAITLGRGDGTFEPPNHFAIPGPVAYTWDNVGAISLQAKDFDLDGQLDLLVSETKGKKILFYKGLGDGTFLAAREQSTGTDISGYKVADLNADGILDLIAMRADTLAFGVLLGNGDGSFQQYAEFSTHTGYSVNHNFAIGDLNGDGVVDFVSGNHATRLLNVYLGNGDGTFTRGVDLASRGVFSDNTAVLDWSMALVIGDFSGNGYADIAYTAYSNSGFGTGYGGGIALYEGDGSGTTFTWSTAVDVAMSLAPMNIHGDAQPIDLNGDGHLDFVFTGPGEWGNYAPGVNVALNDGTGKFTSTFWIDSNMGTHPQPSNLNNGLGVLVGDFNNDGMLDLLTARNGRQHIGNQFSSVSLMLADNPGTYRAAYDVRASSAMWGTVSFIEYADFNNDGILDLWGPAYQNPSFTQLGNGDGTFQRPITATPWIGNEGLGKGFAADLDLDGNMDVVWSGQGGIQGGPQGRYLAALGNGDGTFRITYAQTGNNTTSGYAPLVVKPADFDGDGYLDFVALTGLNTIEIMRNVPEVPGTFTRSYNVPFGASTLRPSLNVGDFNGDGVPDVIAVRERSGNVHDLLFYQGSGDGTLHEPVLFPFAPDTADFRFPKHIAVGDLNSDGNLDFAINASYHRSAVVLGNGDGTFQPPMVYRTGTIFGDQGGLHLIDLNSDGHLDLASMEDTVSQRTLEVRLGIGDGTFGKAQLWGTSEGTGQLAFGDLDNDGRVDVGINGNSRQEAVATFLGNRQGLSGVLTTDINDDGHTDILAINHDNSHVKRLVSNGLGDFTRLDDLLVGAGPVDLLSGDLNGNGHTDFLTINRSGRSISVMLADGPVGYSRTDVPVGQLPVAGVLGNVTGGSQDDLLVIDNQLNALFVLTQDGSGTFTESALIPLGDQPSAIALGHIDGAVDQDGTVDVIISLAETNRLMILRSLGEGQFAAPTYVNLPAKPGKLAATDLNGDGLLDLAVTFPETGEVALLFGMGQSRFTQPQRIRVGNQPDSIVLADANGDRLLDILVTNAGDNTASVILNRFDPNQLYRYDALALDPDDDAVTYSILAGPGGLILDTQSGAIRWAPSGDQLGLNRVVLQADDGQGGTTTQEFSIHVEPARTNTAPVITNLPSHSISASETFAHTVSAIDPEGDRLRYRLLDGPEGSTLGPVTGLLEWEPRGHALQFNSAWGAQGHVQMDHHDSHNVDSLTIEGWFRFSSTGGNQVLVNKALNWATPAFYTLRYFSGSLQFLIGDGTGAGVETLSIAQSIQPEQWIHLAATFDDSTGMMRLLVNGNQVAAKETSKRIGAAGANIPLFIGSDVYPFTGDAFGLRLWSEPKSSTELTTAIHQQLGPTTPSLFVDLRFEEGDSLTVVNHALPVSRGLLKGSVVPRRISGFAHLETAQFTVAVEDGKGGSALQTLDVSVTPQLRGSISGSLFQDDNGDGSKQATEPPLANWTVFIDTNGNGYRDAYETFSTTDASGTFQFTALLAGSYPIAVETPAGFTPVGTEPISVTSQLSSPLAIPARPAPGGQLRGSLTLAESSQPFAHHHVFADLNGNGIFDPLEPHTFTDRSGQYALTGLPAGNYSVRSSVPAGWSTTTPESAAHDVVLSHEGLLADLDFVLAPRDALSARTPMIVTQPPRMSRVHETYRYAVAAKSPDGRTIAYSLSLAPTGMVIDPSTGHIVWTPTGKQSGSHQVIVRAATDNSSIDLQAFAIEVAAANTAPIVVSRPASPAVVNRPWSYPVVAQDAEQSELVYELESAPAGATIAAETGLILWTPHTSHIGVQSFIVSVHDAVGGVTRHAFDLQVVADAPATRPFTIRAPRTDAALLNSYLSRVSGVDSTGQPLSAELLSGPSGLNLDASGFLQWQPRVSQLGEQTLQVRFRSASGDSEDHSFLIHVRQTVGNSAPRIESAPSSLFASSLFATAGQLYVYDPAVTDNDGDALSFELLTAPAGMSIHPQLGTLRWLPTLDQLGQSTVTLQVVDPQGGLATQSFTLKTRRLGGPPRIESIPPTHAAVGSGYLYSLLAVDAENDPLTYSLIEAPAGMTIDARTGEIAWTPTPEQLGQQAVFIAVADASGNRATQSFAIQVAAGVPNRAPVISSAPNLFATVGEPYRYDLQATDPEGSTVTYSLRRGPEGLTNDPQSGRVTWTPTAGQAGREVVTLVATDVDGGAAVQSFEIDILGVNSVPQIISTAPAFAWAGGEFQYDVITRDADRGPIRYEFTSPVRGGMTLDPLGRIRWQTSVDDIGTHSLTVRASDPRGGAATQQIELEVRADNVAPKVTVLPRGGGWPWDGPIVVLVSAVDNVAVTDIELRVNDVLVPLDANRTARLAFEDWGPGVLNMVATARDAAGNAASGTGVAFYRDPEVDYESGEGLPVAAITSPSDDGTVYGMVEILGTAIGGTAAATGFKEYRLSYARLDQVQFTEFVHNTTQVTDGLLGVWDTTLLENDSYVLRLEVVSEAGNTSVHETTVGLSGNLKLGNFRLSFEDLTIPVAGIPITIIRTYDTLRADRDGDFGYGWRMEYRNTDLRVSLPKSGLEDLGIYTPFRSGTKIYATLPGGQRVGWTFTPEMKVLPGWAKGNDLVMASPRYTPDRGNTATLSAGNGWLTVNQFGELYATAGMPWNPASPDFGGGFTVTLADGTRYFIDAATGLMQTATDRNGNRLTFSDSGITSSLGDIGISIARDRNGRITSITDPAGNAIGYGYSVSGDLVRVTDREGHSTMMTYRTDRLHYLNAIVDPLGRTGARTEYNADGRLVAMIDVRGNAIRTTYDPDSSLVTTYDELGHPTIHEYDLSGNVVSLTDALGHVTTSTYDLNDNLSSLSDPLGNTIRYAYDHSGNLLQTVDALGNKTYSTFDLLGNQTSSTDAMGNTWSFRYDAKGNMVGRIAPNGGASAITTDSTGAMISTIFPDGSSIQSINDSAGRPLISTDTLGRRTSSSYDPLGNLKTSRQIVRDSNGERDLTTAYEYDREGRVTSNTNPIGQVTSILYNAAGQQVETIRPGNVRELTVYDERGYPLTRVLSDGRRIEIEVDAAGRVIARTDEAGRTTRFIYDALGREITTVHPDDTPNDDSDNPRNHKEYDAAGRLISVVDEIGRVTQYRYDAAGRQTMVIDPLGGQQIFAYDAVGRVSSVTNAAGSTTNFNYDALGNEIEVTFADGTRIEKRYDILGNLRSEVDQLGRITSYEYDAGGRLTTVVDAMGGTTRYEYNDLDSLVRQIDANGNVYSYEYDDLARRVLEIRPLGERATTEYDSQGRMDKVTDFNGIVITFEYNDRQLLAAQRASDGSFAEFTYTPSGKLSTERNATGLVEYTYDVRDRLTSRTNGDNQTITYTYDKAGQLTSITSPTETVTYHYDDLSRITSVIDSDDRVTRYSYDAIGNLLRTELPNGIVEDHLYTQLNQLLLKETRNQSNELLAQYSYTFDSTGRRISLVELDGRSVEYVYDANYRLVAEIISVPGFSEHRIEYTYDAVSNRLTRNDSLYGITHYEYDANDQLSRTIENGLITDFVYDSNGTLITRQNSERSINYRWNGFGQLSGVSIEVSGVLTNTDYFYDASGNRTSQVVNGAVTNYLMDTNRPFAQVLAKYDENGNVLVSYLLALDIISQSSEGDPKYLGRDGSGSTRYVTDDSGRIVDAYTYDAFGRSLTVNGGVSEFQYRGEQRDASTGLDFLRGRYLDVDLGRFISVDPYEGDLRIPSSLNDYIYAASDPVNGKDPSGLVTVSELSSVTGILNALNVTILGTVIGYKSYAAYTAGQLTALRLLQIAGTEIAFNIAGGYALKGIGVGAGILSKSMIKPFLAKARVLPGYGQAVHLGTKLPAQGTNAFVALAYAAAQKNAGKAETIVGTFKGLPAVFTGTVNGLTQTAGRQTNTYFGGTITIVAKNLPKKAVQDINRLVQQGHRLRVLSPVRPAGLSSAVPSLELGVFAGQFSTAAAFEGAVARLLASAAEGAGIAGLALVTGKNDGR